MITLKKTKKGIWTVTHLELVNFFELDNAIQFATLVM